MSKTKHTKGPWVIGPEAVDENRRQEHLIGLPNQPDGLSMTERVANYAANAVLISAAPDMLEALEAIVIAHDNEYPDTVDEEDNSMIRRARAAIAKARGEK